MIRNYPDRIAAGCEHRAGRAEPSKGFLFARRAPGCKEIPFASERRLPAAASVFLWLWLAACGAPAGAPHWLKAGTDEAEMERELQDCNARARAELAQEQQNIDATVDMNRLLQGVAVVPFSRQVLLQQAVEHAEQVVGDCMRAKGFTREG